MNALAHPIQKSGEPGQAPALMPPPRFDVLTVPVSAVNMETAVAAIESWASSDIRTYVCITGAHGILECRRDAKLLAIHRDAGMVTPDGMPLVWTARALGLNDVHRVYGPDLMHALSQRADINGLRHFYYGGAEGIAERLAACLRAQSPLLNVVGTYTPPFRPLTEAEDIAVIDMINAARPDVLWVGLSTPKQERWMQAHRDLLDVPVMIGVGAAFDFLSGAKRQAPKWMQRGGLEWLFRLGSEPRRLSGRYAVIVPYFAILSIPLMFDRTIQAFRMTRRHPFYNR
ncbi:WecB/TagA/CpsF family glycosyltransferase [Aurantimonas sp. 22II-16-19i]|uniref:WecB/TagA/CpsF family glycosyltransferase n=1 Tax=Aurantimonas sp. 22II-16-19i TaxID=1317114 RepID=UPI001FD9BBCD|nr:WecB/TagA/CpsF family glycosyltransferase [Aurantimonas sp. 22II-16-19i]